jgi:hypothetical protein
VCTAYGRASERGDRLFCKKVRKAAACKALFFLGDMNSFCAAIYISFVRRGAGLVYSFIMNTTKNNGAQMYMRACSTASGGVIFVPDTIERKTSSVSYSQLVKGDAAPKKRFSLFGRKLGFKKQDRHAA